MDQYQGNFGDQQNEQGTLTWVCPKCHTLNQKSFCCCCGYKRKLPSEKNPWKIVSIVLILVIIGFVVFLFLPSDSDTASDSVKMEEQPARVSVLGCVNGHNFAAATCEEPKTCKDCGETEGSPLGHDYSEATCTEASRCTRCLKKNGEALSHNWLPATYDSPKRCDRCGETSGNVKGYYETLKGSWKDTRVSVGGCDTTPWIFDEPVKNCVKFSMYFKIEDVDYGKVTGKHTLYTKENGKWKKLSTFNVSDNSAVEKTFEFKDPVNITQLAVVPPYRSSYSYSFSLGFYDWYLHN